jgi:hypothetical protein
MDVDQTTVPLLNLNKLMNSERFLAAAETEDELGCVLRIHLCLESFLEEFLKHFIAESDQKYHKDRLTFSEKLSLAVAYKLPKSIAEPIQIINRLRNKFAHADNNPLTEELNFRLADHIDQIDFPGKNAEWTVRRTYIEYSTARPGEKLNFGEHGPRIDFLLASSRLLADASRWLVMEYIKQNPNAVSQTAPLPTPGQALAT